MSGSAASAGDGDRIGAWPVAAIRAVEDELLARTPPGALMQRAAAGLAAACLRELRRRRGRVTGSRAVLLVGAGNNGGDALWAGARLAGRGVAVDAVQLGPTLHAEGLAGLRAAGGRLTGPDDAERLLRAADLVVDGLVGIGGTPGLREPAAGVVRALDALRGDGRGPLVVAVDLPSGVDPDTGETPAAHVRADLTVTFGAPKPCLLLPPADRAAGRLGVVDIGLLPGLAGHEPAVERLTPAGAARLWPVPSPEADKYRRGVVGVVAGCPSYTGAAVLAVGGALRAGAGMVRYVGPEHPAEQVRLHWPEAVVGRGRVQAWVLGSGVDLDDDDGGQAGAVRAALAEGLPCVVDAGGLALLGTDPSLRSALHAGTVLTPHAGELARLLTAVRGGTEVERGEVEARPLAAARELVAATGATVLVKGATTLVVPPHGPVRSVSRAPAWLATAGAGDVLAGILGTLLAAGLDPADAAALAADVHGRAATRASQGEGAGQDDIGGPGGPVVAGDVGHALPGAVRALLSGPRLRD